MTSKRKTLSARAIALVSAVSLLMTALFTVPGLSADQRGSVRHSSKKTKGGTTTRTTATRSITRPPGPSDDPSSPAQHTHQRARRLPGRLSPRELPRWHNARNDYWKWRTVTGLFKLGVYAATRPKQSTTVVVTGTTCYYSGGVYYMTSGSGYVVVAPPPGAVVYSVPTYSTVVYVGTTEYVYVSGAYYVPTTKPAEQPPPPDPNATQTAASPEEAEDPSEITMKEGGEEQNYEVVAPPVGATVPYLPDEAEEKTVGGKKYFVYSDTYYRAFASDGDTVYMVVADPSKQG